jgi:hypothetical protein
MRGTFDASGWQPTGTNVDRRTSGTKVRDLGTRARDLRLFRPLPAPGHAKARYISSSQTRGASCVHTAAHTVAFHPEQGWSLLCNGVIVFDDMGAILPDGRVIPPHVGLPVAA